MTDWKRIWKEFDKWCDDVRVSCDKCGKQQYFKSWSEQKKQIEKLVKEDGTRESAKNRRKKQ